MTDKEIIEEQKEMIQMLHSNIHGYAAEIVRLRSQIRVAWSALQTGHDVDVAAAIHILGGLK